MQCILGFDGWFTSAVREERTACRNETRIRSELHTLTQRTHTHLHQSCHLSQRLSAQENSCKLDFCMFWRKHEWCLPVQKLARVFWVVARALLCCCQAVLCILDMLLRISKQLYTLRKKVQKPSLGL